MKELIIKIISRIFKFISSCVPKNKNLWVFGAWRGELYSDNTKYLYEYMNENHKEVNTVWISKQHNIVNHVRNLGYNAEYAYSFRGIITVLRAKYAFETEGSSDISSFVNNIYERNKTMQILLWHGMGFKRLHIDDGSKKKNIYADSYWMGTSELYNKTTAEVYNVPLENFYTTGYPRNDVIIQRKENFYFEKIKQKYKDSKIILYMPTHRNYGQDGDCITNITELIRLDKYFKDKNWVMIYKPHIHEMENVSCAQKEFSNIIIAKDTEVFGDPYSYLSYCDLLISDYSSIITDFACLNRPIIYYVFDLEYFKKNNILLPYFYNLPLGPFCHTWDEVLSEINNAFSFDGWKVTRSKNSKNYHAFNDGHNCRRVYETMINSIYKIK